MNVENQNKRLHLIVEGLVQGVSFRYYTQEKAKELDLTGWVKNLEDGSVEIIAEGENGKLKELETWAHQGPPAANVSQVHTRWLEFMGELKDFTIRRG